MAKHGATHIMVPDTQVEPGTPTIHLEWIGQFIADEYASPAIDLTVIQIGDWYDMASLSSYDKKGGRRMEGRRYIKDVDAGNAAWDLFNEPWKDVPADRHFLYGNHEQRILRVIDNDATQEGVVGYHHLAVNQWEGWTVHDFLEPLWVDGICYSHYLYNPMTGRPLGGTNLETRIKTVGHTFTVGHTQGLKWARVDTIKGPHIGLQAGSCYLHDPDYLGPQSINYWRGIVVKHQVQAGGYDPMFVSLDYLCRRYEGKSLAALKWRK